MTDIFYPVYPRVLGSRNEIFILDGGFSTQIQQHAGKDSFEGRPQWTSELNTENPEAVKRSHMDYLSNCSGDLISSNTYQAASSSIEKAVELCDEAILEASHVPRKAGIVGSLGPYAAFQPSGSEYNSSDGMSYPPLADEELKEWYKDRIRHLMIAGVDVIAFETMPCIKEALVALDIIDNVINAKCWISFQCRDGKHLAYGESFKDAVERLLNHPAFVKRKLLYIGINCTSPKYISSLLKLAERVNKKMNFPDKYGYWRIPYVVYPNRGVYCKEKCCYVLDKDDPLGGGDEGILKRCHEWMLLGTRVIGGCCGVDANLIKEIRNQVSEHLFDVLDKENDIDYFIDHEVIESRLLKPVEKDKIERRTKTNDFTDSLWNMCEMPYKNPGWVNE
uniref:Homocysteine S-methyltransferase 1 n=1 Tax=Caligus clemensi TaxID=344056 RepID=C1C2Y0_CALCM|nr:Homocysteine S-methyltransferase 1 [Caligus clemensi]